MRHNAVRVGLGGVIDTRWNLIDVLCFDRFLIFSLLHFPFFTDNMFFPSALIQSNHHRIVFHILFMETECYVNSMWEAREFFVTLESSRKTMRHSIMCVMFKLPIPFQSRSTSGPNSLLFCALSNVLCFFLLFCEHTKSLTAQFFRNSSCFTLST